jgi:hypothetical protein
MVTDVNDDNDTGNGASLTTSNEGDNRNRNDGKDACAMMATMPAHWCRQQITPWTRQWGGGDSGLQELLVFRSYLCLE